MLNAIGILTITLLLLLFSQSINIFELKTIDSRFHLRNMLNSNPNFSDNISHVNIDNYSKQQSGFALWSKEYYAKLIKKISEGGAEITTCDIMFVEWEDTTGNNLLVNSIINAGNVVSPYMLSLDSEEKGSNEERQILDDAFAFDLNPPVQSGIFPRATDIMSYPLLDIVEQSAGLGYANIYPDDDGVVRRVPVVVELDRRLVPSLFFQSLCSYLDYDLENVEVVDKSRLVLHQFPENQTNAVRSVGIPLDDEGNLLVNFAGPFDSRYYPNSHSAWDLLKMNGQPDLSGKLVLLSDISTQGGDFSPIPLDRLFPRSYIISNAINTVLSGEYIQSVNGMIYIPLVIGFLAVVLNILCVKLDTFWFSISALIMAGLYVGGTFAIFILGCWIIPIFPVMIPLSVVYFVSGVYKHSHTERYKGVLEGSLKSYLSPTLMEKIKENPDLLKIGGQRKRITVLFSDIMNFTSFCDKSDPQEVQDVLETYFKEMAEIIFSLGGIVDKYLGDGILAFFENPEDTIRSAEVAVRTAIEIQRKSIELDRVYREQNRFPFAVRVGIATGYAKVGNIGPVEKIDYTIIGGVVNLASRLQTFGESGDIVIDKDTLFFVKDDYDIESIGKQSLKGFSGEIQVYKIKY